MKNLSNVQELIGAIWSTFIIEGARFSVTWQGHSGITVWVVISVKSIKSKPMKYMDKWCIKQSSNMFWATAFMLILFPRVIFMFIIAMTNGHFGVCISAKVIINTHTCTGYLVILKLVLIQWMYNIMYIHTFFNILISIMGTKMLIY